MNPRRPASRQLGTDEVPGDVLAFYTGRSAMSSAGRHANLLADLPGDPAELARIVQGLLLHEHVAPAYGVLLTDERRAESQIRPVARMIDRILAHDARNLAIERTLDARLVCVCRHFTLMMVAMLRAHRIPARARCGFASYFEPGKFVDHWVCEYWRAGQARWVLVDAQIDALHRGVFKPDFDPLDVPRDRFVIAGEAWMKCRAGQSDPARFGILNMWGLWFIAGNVLRDFAALNNVEMLPWDVWGGLPQSDSSFNDDQFVQLDELARLTLSPDEFHDEIRRRYQHDDIVRVPPVVFNAIRQRAEAALEP
jgi:Transglutaminase-like superfamily